MAGQKSVSSFGKYRGDSDRAGLLEELQDVISELNNAYINFNSALEPELIEACIYEINALQARYAYLLRSARAQGMKNISVFRFPKQEQNQPASEC